MSFGGDFTETIRLVRAFDFDVLEFLLFKLRLGEGDFGRFFGIFTDGSYSAEYPDVAL